MTVSMPSSIILDARLVGARIWIVEDAWIFDVLIERMPTFIKVGLPDDLKVELLLVTDMGCQVWALEDIGGEPMVSRIKEIPLPKLYGQDTNNRTIGD